MWKTYLFRAEEFAEKAEELVEQMEHEADLLTADFDDGDEESEATPLNELVSSLLKDQPFLDFKQVPGVTCYLTDTCYQVYVYEDLFLEYVGDDARNFVTSVLIFKRHKAYRDEDWLCLNYDSGMTSTPLVPGERVRWLQLHKRGAPNPPPPVLLRPTANLNEKDWTHATDVSSGNQATFIKALEAIREQANDHNPDRVHATIRACYHLANDALRQK